MARTIDILKRVAPDLPEGKTCEKKDLCRDIVKKRGKREQKLAVALTSEWCKLLDDCEKSELSTMLGFPGNKSSSDISDDDESSDEDGRSSTNDNKDSERIVRARPMIMMPLNNVRRRNQKVPHPRRPRGR